MERRNITDSPMEIYVHIPFCIKKCDYCDFLSGPSGPKEQADYVDALLEEINAAEEGKGRSVSSVFIGGGTPSVLDERFIGEILNHIRRKFQIADYAEITIEVNPGTADRNKLQAYRTYGINRLSIGLQSPDDRELKILGRIHNYEQFLETYRSAREAGFDNINIDLMSAIPDQTYEGWIHNLRTVAGLDPEHISAYSLIVEEGTPLYEEYGEMCADLEKYGDYASMPKRLQTKYEGCKCLPDEETDRNMYHHTKTTLAKLGYERYEISNYARPGYACRHNIGYWIGVEYLGLGLGVSSLVGGKRFQVTADLNRYLVFTKEELAAGAQYEEIHELSRQERMEEFMFLGLRKTKGISKKEFIERFGCSMDSVYGKPLIESMKQGMMKEEGDRVFLTQDGTLVSNQVLCEFLFDEEV